MHWIFSGAVIRHRSSLFGTPPGVEQFPSEDLLIFAVGLGSSPSRKVSIRESLAPESDRTTRARVDRLHGSLLCLKLRE